MVDAQGNTFFAVSNFAATSVLGCVEGDPTGISTGFTQNYYLIKLAPDGTITQTSLPINEPLQSTNGLTVLAPDGNGGALVQWITGQGNNFSVFMMDSSAGVTYPSPLPNGITQLVAGQAGNAIATDGTTVAAFDFGSGSTQWASVPSQNNLSTLFAGDSGGGGVTVLDSQSNLIQVNSQGTTTSTASCPG